MWTTRGRGAAALVALLLVMAVAAAGCGESTGEGGGTTTTTKTYTSQEHGFSITYSDRFTQGQPSGSEEAGNAPVFTVGFADRDGAAIDGKAIDYVQVSVYRLKRPVSAIDMPLVRRELRRLVDQLVSSTPDAGLERPLTRTEVNGIPGFVFKAHYSEQGTPITVVSFFLFNADREYQVLLQAASENWPDIRDELEAAAKSFRVE